MTPHSSIDYFALSGVLNVIASILLGAIVWLKDRSKPLHITYALFCLSIAFWSTNYSLWLFAKSLDAAEFYFRLVMAGAILIPVFYAHHLCYLLNCAYEKRGIIRLSYISAILSSVSVFTPYFMHSFQNKPPFPYWPNPGTLFYLYLILFSIFVIYGIWLIYERYRSSSRHLRKQLQYVLIASIVGWMGGLTDFPLWFNVRILPYGNILVSVYVCITAYAIYKHRLMDITVIVRKTLIYSVVMGTLTVIYLTVVALIAHIFEGISGYQTIFSSAIAAGLITIGFQPLRKKVQTLVDGKFFRQYVDREEKLYELSREVITHTTSEAMAESLVRVLGDTLHPKAVALYLRARDGSGFVLTSSAGEHDLPAMMVDNNDLANYLSDHPQPFVQQDVPASVGEPVDTRRPLRKEDAA